MISSFCLKQLPPILFGPGKLAELENLIPEFGCRPLLVLGSRSFLATDHYQAVQRIFERLGMSVQSVNVRSEPSPEIVNEIVANPLYSEIDLVISIGGGSTLDAGKAISAMLVEKGDVTRFLEGVGSQTPSGRKLPFIAIPTTSGTGSEATSNAVISSVGKQGFKNSLRHDNYIPDLALVDPALTLSCPKELTIACSMDCFTQLVEGYLSTNGSSLTDSIALDGIKAIRRSLRKVCSDPTNLEARTDLSYGALLSGIVLANAGLGTVHGFASAIGGLFAIPHGIVCGTLMAPVNRLTLKNLQKTDMQHPALKKYAMLGMLFSDKRNQTDSWYQNHFIEEVERLAADLEIPALVGYGVTETDIEKIVAKTGNKYNPAPLTKEELAKILLSRMSSPDL
jgi:alcohol dehydrogenase class IV